MSTLEMKNELTAEEKRIAEKGPDYKNWIPAGMTVSLVSASAGLAAGALGAAVYEKEQNLPKGLKYVLAAGAAGMGAAALWSMMASAAFSYKGRRKLSEQVINGIAEYIDLPENGVGLDVGCGSGALTIAAAKRNPQGRMVGIDRWGKDYASYSLDLCCRNALAEDAENVTFRKGDAVKLNFADGAFDAVTSNYVYHNISGADKQALLKETLRVLKKGGTFAIHDIMTPARYGDMEKFRQELLDEGYEKVELIDTTRGRFMMPNEAALYMLKGSALLYGIK